MNVALIASAKNNYSETFIKAHKERLKAEVFFYYGDIYNSYLENYGSLKQNHKSFWFRLQRRYYRKNYRWFFERLFLDSLKKNNIDVILAEFGDVAHKFIDPIKESGIPLIVHFHGRDATVTKIIENCGQYKKVFATAQKVVVVSKRMYDDLLKLGCPEEKLVYNVYGPHEEFFEVRPDFFQAQFISLGRFVNKKAPYYLILSFIEVLKKFPEAKLIMGGDGPLKETCENLVRYFDLTDSVIFLGVITPEIYRKHLRESIALVQHSVTAKDGDSEGTPVAILEASAAGVPVISTRHAGILDVVISGETGYLVEEHDVKGMALKMMEVLKDTGKARELGQKAKENLLRHYTLERHIHILNEMIYNLHNSKKS